MSLFKLKSTIRITCPKRMATWLKTEVEELGYTPEKTDDTGVEFTGNMHDCMILNLWLRTAHKVLFMIDEFECRNQAELYDNIVELPWEDYIPANGYFSVDSTVFTDSISHTQLPNLKVKDAIADRILKAKNKRPDSGNNKDRTVVYLYWKNDSASIYVDTSGETIANHNYRVKSHKAPMQETLAAAIIYASGWDRKKAFLNPMCGSGTLAIEAGMMAMNIAPGLGRNNFGFMHIEGYDEIEFDRIRKEAEKKIIRKPHLRIIATDIDSYAINALKTNAQKAGVLQLIDYDIQPFEEIYMPDENAIIVMNPEYGERMGEEEKLKEVYKNIGSFFKQRCAGKMAFVFTGNLKLAKEIGLKTKRKIEFYSAKLDCRLLSYEMYAGSRREK